MDKDTFQEYNKYIVIGGNGFILMVNVIFLFFRWINWRKIWSEMRIWPVSMKYMNIDSDEVAKITLTSTNIAMFFSP